ncbi:MAG: FKBP-type peptidyl-prolyl cis-trans isomerase [Prevotella sp.]|nr:FKBP-type peptidyl-prolyl cis-trans isomerase [Prevotella sp.]
MKKLTFVAAMAIGVAALTSCGGAGAPKAYLNSDIDSLSYATGVSLADELKNYNVLEQQFGVDSAYINDFIQGVMASANAGDDKKQAAYYAGVQIGNMLNAQIIPNMTRQFLGDDSTRTLSRPNLLAAFVDVLSGKDAKITSEEAQAVQQRFQMEQQKVQMAKQRELRQQQQAERWAAADKENAEKFADYKAKNEQFLADNKSKEGVQTLPSGLQYKVITEGTGEKPAAGSYVKVNYEGKLIDGTVFDSSFERNQPAQFSLDQVIAGWTEVLQLMPVGSEWEVYIPQQLAYGPENQEKIKPYSTLIFKIQLLDIIR